MKRNDPLRLSPDATALLRVARGPRPRTPEERARTTAKVRLLSTTAAAGGLTWLAGWKSVAAAALIAAAGATATLVARHAHARVHASVSASHAPSRVVAPGPPPLRAPPVAAPASVAAPEPSRDVRPTTGTPQPTSAGPARSALRAHGAAVGALPLSEAPEAPSESALLGRALTALPHDPSAALHDVQAMATAWPEGSFVPERECIALQALERLGRPDEARARALALLQRYPEHLCAERARRLMEQDVP